MRTRYHNPNSTDQIQTNKSRAQTSQLDKQKKSRMYQQLAIRNNPFLEALEAKKRLDAEKSRAEIDLLPISVEDAINLEKQLHNDSLEMDVVDEQVEVPFSGDAESFEVCPCCFKPTLALLDPFTINCSSCFLKVASKGESLKAFVKCLLNHISQHEILGCCGMVMFSFQADLGLFSACSQCDEIMFIA